MVALLLFVVAEADAPTPEPPVVTFMGDEAVDVLRIEDVFRCGHNMNECLWEEDPALMLARVAVGESPSSPNDQIYIMWLIKLRAHLGFKHAGDAGNGAGWCGTRWCYTPGRWGTPTTIQEEALCDGGCQFSAVRASLDIFYPCLLSEYHPLRKMLCPIDADLNDLAFARDAAQWVLDSPLSDFPEELRGYDNFRSPSIVGIGQRNREGGLRSWQAWPRANIWRDEFKDDNLFWDQLSEDGRGHD